MSRPEGNEPLVRISDVIHNPLSTSFALTPKGRQTRRTERYAWLDVNQQCQFRKGDFFADVLVLGRRNSSQGPEFNLLVTRSNHPESIGENIRFRPESHGSAPPARLYPPDSFQVHKVAGNTFVYDMRTDDEYLDTQAQEHVRFLLELARKERAECLLLRTDKGKPSLQLEIGGRLRPFSPPPGHLFPNVLRQLKKACVRVERHTPELFRGDILYTIRGLRRRAACFIEGGRAMLSFSRA